MAANKGHENLRPIRETARAKELGRQGGIASGAAKAKAKAEKDRLKLLLECVPDHPPKRLKALADMGVDMEDCTIDTLIAVALYKCAVDGDLRAIEYIDKRMGRHPDQRLKIEEMKAKYDYAEDG